ncbi:MAG: hypothetical protein JNM86_15275 [Phycisphaerae bacterium]|nr:hypothetical protein [Phycisphaerae bacterium]
MEVDIAFDGVACGRCGYPLDGLEDCSKCPECGFDIPNSVQLHAAAFLKPIQARKLARRLRLLSVLQVAACPTIILCFFPDIVSKALGGIPGTASWNRGPMGIALLGSMLLLLIRLAYFAAELTRTTSSVPRIGIALAAVRCVLGLSVPIWAVQRWNDVTPINVLSNSDSIFWLVFGVSFFLTGLAELAVASRMAILAFPDLSSRWLTLSIAGYAMTLPAFLAGVPMCVFGFFVFTSPLGCLCLGAANWLMARQVEGRFGTPLTPPVKR